jgi:titin
LNPGSANNLLIVSQPTTEMNGRAFVTQPVIQIRDAQNNSIVTNTPVSVVASINTGSGTLSGATSVATNSTGLATFTDLMVTGNTGSYTLTFAVVGLSIDSNSFALTPGDQTITRSTFGSTALPNGTYTPTANAYSGLSVAISIASTSATVCSIDQLGKVTFLKMGDCAIKYNQTGNTHWSAAPELVETLSVGRLTQTTTFAAIDDQPFGGTDVALTASAQSGLLVTFAVTSASTICVLNTATTVQIVGLGTCTVVASQSGDEVWAPASDVTRSFVIGTVRPATPTVSSVSAGNTQATISWNPPTHNGGSQILGYRVTSQPDGLTCSTTNSTDSSCIVTGLTNGTEYTFVVQALNAIGYSNASTASPEVTPATTADAVVGLTLTSTNKKLTANWIMPEQLGGGNFVRFEMFIRETGGNYGDAFTSNDANLTTFDFTKLDPNDNTNVSDLINGESYDVKIVIITDAIMAGDQSVTVLAGNSTEATQVPADVASAPTNATILTTDGTQASVSWIASSSNGGAVITAYSVTATANNVAVTCVMQLQLDTSCEISSLTPGQVINVSIQAVNRIGNSVAATASMKLPTPPAPPTMNAATAGSGFIQVTWAVPASDGGMALTGYVAKAMVRGTNQVVAECTTIGTSCDLMVSGTEFDFDFAVWSMNRVGMSDSSNMLSPKRPTVSPTPTPSPSGPRTRSSGTTNAGAAVAIFDTRRPVFMPNGELPELNVGTTMAWQNGQLVQVNLVSAGTSALQLSAAGGVVLQMQTLHVSGQPMDVAANGMLQVFHNRSIRIAGSGFAPNSMATVWLFSEPVKLGEIQTDANGGFAELFAINTSIPLGDHTIQINGQHTDGSVRTVAMGVSIFGEDFAPEEVVTDASGPSDSDSNQALGVIGAVGLAFIGGIGVGILMLSQRKRKS